MVREDHQPEPHDPGSVPGDAATTATHRIERRLPADTSAPAAARQIVADVSASLPPELTTRAELAISELVTNAVIHGAAPGGAVTLAVEASVDRLVVDVVDSGDSKPTEPDGRGGYGLGIVREMADVVQIDDSGPWRVVAAFTPR